MNPPNRIAIDDRVTCIDSGLGRPGFAACYLIADGDELAVVDCGTRHSVPRILEAIHAAGARPEQVRWILPTHVHLDHAGGAGALLRHCPHATLATHPRGAPHLVDPRRLRDGAVAVYGEAAFARDYGDIDPAPDHRVRALEDGAALPLGRGELRFVHTPGHANHHGCLFDPVGGHLFTGDAFGLGYPELVRDGRPLMLATTTPVAFDPDAWQRSLDRLLELDARDVCLTHYGCHPDPAVLAPMLRESIEDHRRIALEEEARGDENGREARLREAVERLLIERAAAHGGLSADRVRELLAGDIALNAQGLAVWLARRARRRAEAQR